MSSRQVFKTLREYELNREQEKVFQAVLGLKRRRLINFRDEGKTSIIRLTRAGKQVTLQFQVDGIQLPRDEKWDKKWRLILFDIPEYHGKARRALSKKLKDMGALQLQRSVFIYPHECRNEIDFVAEFFEVSPYVRYAEVSSIEGEKNLKKHFEI